MLALTAAQRFRAAVASSKSKVAQVERLASRLPDDDLRNPDSRGVTSLALAAAAGNVELCEWLILDEGHEEGEISRDTAGETIVHIAAAHGHARILELYLSQYPFVVTWVDSRGATPLHVAAMRGELEAAQIIVNCAGLDIVDAPELYGNTALHYACSWGKNQVVKLLVEMDCDVSAKNNEGFTASDYAFSFTTLRALEDYIRAHAEHLKRQRSRKTSPKRDRSHAAPTPAQVGSRGDDLAALPSTPPVGLGLGFDRDAGSAQSEGANTTPARSLRPPISPTQQRSTSSNLSSQASSTSPSADVPSAASPQAESGSSRPSTPVIAGSRPISRPSTPQRSPLSLKRLSRNPSTISALAPTALTTSNGGTAADVTTRAPTRSRSHSVLPGQNDLAPLKQPNRSVSMKLQRKSSAGRGPPPPPPMPLAEQSRTRTESAYSEVSSGSSHTPVTGATSRAESTFSSPARSRANSTQRPPPLLMHRSSSSTYQPSPPPSPNIAVSTISNLLKSSSLGKKERERKGSFSSAVDADGRVRSGSNESQVGGGRVARALGLGKRHVS